MFTLIGPEATNVLREVGGEAMTVLDASYGSHQLLRMGSSPAPLMLMSGCGMEMPGYTLIVDESAAADVYGILVNKGCLPMGSEDWERVR